MPKSTNTKLGRPLRYSGNEPMQSLQVRLPTPMIAWIDKMAHKLDWSRPEVIRAAIESGKGEVEKP